MARGHRDHPEGEPHREGPARHGQERRRRRAEREQEEREREGKRAPLGAVGRVGARAPEVVVEGRLSRPSQAGAWVHGSKLGLQARRGAAQPGQQAIRAALARREADHHERAAARAHEVRVLLVAVGEGARHLRALGERADDPVEHGPPLRPVRRRHSGEDEERAAGEGRLEALLENPVDLGRLAAEDPRRDLEPLLDSGRERQEGRGGHEPREGDRPPRPRRTGAAHRPMVVQRGDFCPRMVHARGGCWPSCSPRASPRRRRPSPRRRRRSPAATPRTRRSTPRRRGGSTSAP